MEKPDELKENPIEPNSPRLKYNRLVFGIILFVVNTFLVIITLIMKITFFLVLTTILHLMFVIVCLISTIGALATNDMRRTLNILSYKYDQFVNPFNLYKKL